MVNQTKNQNQNQNQNTSLILNLESLTKQYDTLLIQYNQVQSEYIDYLQKNQGKNGLQSSLDLTKVPNSTFWGTGAISSTNVSTLDQCSALCSKTPGCSGATYNITSNSQTNCWLRSGDGMVVTGTSKQYAIIPKAKNYLLTLQTLNSQLIDTNRKILQVFQQYETLSDQDIDRVQKYNLLKKNYTHLEKERKDILNQLKDHQTIQEKQTHGSLIVTKNYYNYILLLFIVIVCLLILSKTVIDSVGQNSSSTSNSNSNSLGLFFTILISLILILVISYFYGRFR